MNTSTDLSGVETIEIKTRAILVQETKLKQSSALRKV